MWVHYTKESNNEYSLMIYSEDTLSESFWIYNNNLTIDQYYTVPTTTTQYTIIKPYMNFTTDYETFKWANVTIYDDGIETVSS